MSELRDDERNIQVCRSRIDAEVWFCFSDGPDQTDLENTGRVRAVKRYAEETYGGGLRVRWERLDKHTWRMRWPGRGPLVYPVPDGPGEG